MKVLITGFAPFGGESINPAFEAVKLLPEDIKGAEVIKLEIPTVFAASGPAVEEGIRKYQPDVIINVGQAGGRSCVTIERIAINLIEASIPDNDGKQPLGEPIQPEGKPAYYATIPVKAIVKNIRDHKIPCHMSYTAGTYVCNSVMYNVLHMAAERYPHIRAGFIHVPFAAEQAVTKPNGTPFMSLEMIAKSLEYAIEAIVENAEDINEIVGETH